VNLTIGHPLGVTFRPGGSTPYRTMVRFLTSYAPSRSDADHIGM
jgi:hypothetical protein